MSFLPSCIGKCFSARLQTLLISCWPQQEMFRCSQFLWRRGMRKTSRRYPEFATVGHIEILDIRHQWTAAQQWKRTTIDCNTRLASLFESRWNEEIVRNRKWQYYSFCDDSLMETDTSLDSGPPSKYLCNSTSIYCWLDQMWLLTKHFIRYCLYLHISLLTRLLDGEYW